MDGAQPREGYNDIDKYVPFMSCQALTVNICKKQS